MGVAEDLHLADGCARGDAECERAFERRFVASLGIVVARVDGAYPFVDDVADALRQILFERRPTGAIRMYRGHVPLASWLRALAQRLALVIRDERARGPRIDARDDVDPELDYVRLAHYGHLREAFERRTGPRPAEERAALSMRFLEGRSLGDIRARLGRDRTARVLAPMALIALRAMLLDDVTAAVATELGGDDSELRAVLDCVAHARAPASGIVARTANAPLRARG